MKKKFVLGIKSRHGHPISESRTVTTNIFRHCRSKGTVEGRSIVNQTMRLHFICVDICICIARSKLLYRQNTNWIKCIHYLLSCFHDDCRWRLISPLGPFSLPTCCVCAFASWLTTFQI